mmetsp:Transcript_19353/g.55712  ORF Transcript_19353/g.55712 Transcript_19353/m.55712 type:complete len:276 (+) Transcript_19353:357-1184(+)
MIGCPTTASSGSSTVRRPPFVVVPTMHGVDQLPADGANEHAVVFHDGAPVPVLGGKFHDVAVGVVADLGPGRPEAGGDAGGVFGPHGDLDDGYGRRKLYGPFRLLLLLLFLAIGVVGGGSVGRSGWSRCSVVAGGGEGRGTTGRCCAAGARQAQAAHGAEQFQRRRRRKGGRRRTLLLVLEGFDEGPNVGHLRPAGAPDDGAHAAGGAVEANRHGRAGQVVGRGADAADAHGAEHVHLPDGGRIARDVGDAVGAGGGDLLADERWAHRIVRRRAG